MRTALLNTALTGSAIATLYWLTGLYDAALRDPRFFDGWILLLAMGLQFLFHFRKKNPDLPLGRAAGWMRVHIYTGYFVIAAFALHTGFALPDSPFDWALWLLFMLIAISGLAGTYLVRSVPGRLNQATPQISFERIQPYQFQLARDVESLAANSVALAGSTTISDFYMSNLRGFFKRPRNLLAHLRNSSRPVQRLCEKIDALDRYVDDPSKETLNTMRQLVEKKDRLDFQYAHQGALQIWLFVHIPTTYGLIVLTGFHVAIVYAYSSGTP